ncbi:AbrB/MazE/SpoVT family DNA-binding domain-containing protein [Candidatus Roizmanbacteria bacterium]|nr:AbrB/MazE/SpoVT family DNA-binding domain-containing protein [Candidatus Roizmanbacteria bacterium]
MTQKVIKVGNSLGMIFPKELVNKMKMKVGRKLQIEALEETSTIIVRPSRPHQKKAKTAVSPEFKKWLNAFTKKHKALLKELANTP